MSVNRKEFRQHRFQPPRGACDLLLIRHGESAAFVEGSDFPMKDGHGDPALHPNGEAQAIAVGAYLKSWPISAIYVTPLQRTNQTAAPLAQHLGLTPVEIADLREVCLGDWDGGLYRKKVAEQHPLFLKSKASQEWGIIPNAETNLEVKTRVRRGLMQIAKAHPDQTVAVFVHGGVIGAALSLATGADAFSFLGTNNGAISRVVIDGERMIVRGFNDTHHLPEPS